MLNVVINDKSALDALAGILRRAQDYRPVLAEIGEDLTESTKRRFATSTAPDGSTWTANSTVTMERYGEMFGTSLRKKDGSLNKKGQAKLAGKKPLIGESKSLSTTINYQLQGAYAVGIGSPMVYAAMQNYGGTTTQFPHLWGDIPARRFSGASEADKINISNLVRSYLLG